MTPKLIPYGVANYAEMVRDNHYFVDKTQYIARLERVKNPVFLRPRRFGKSLLCSILRYYYDRRYASQFEELFGPTWIGQHPTGKQNQYMVLSLNFSTIALGDTVDEIEMSFRRQVNPDVDSIRYAHPVLQSEFSPLNLEASVSDNLKLLFQAIQNYDLPPLYVIIDEYDNFANGLITRHRDLLYRELTADDSFLKTFFKTLKKGREDGVIANIFVTGILPITIDDLASAFNITTFITLNPAFEAMLGFTQAEVNHLLDDVYRDYAIDPSTRPEIETMLKNHYNGYHFLDPNGEALYNSTILMYFLQYFVDYHQPPEFLTDPNLRTDLSWVQRITGMNPENTQAFLEEMNLYGRIAYDKSYLIAKFNMAQFFDKGFFPITFFYLGMLTKESDTYLRLPNLNLRQIFVEYFNELNQFDVSTRYTALMQAFVNQPKLTDLFAGYWREYISQLPEAIFSKVNENFYRTTFFELCSRHLSKWFTWNIERSYPQGKSDLEFVGKYHEKFAGLRWVIEFKYYSNAEFGKFKVPLDQFPAQKEDIAQLAGYVAGIRQEHPNAKVQQFVIYCVGNLGFRVIEIEPTGEITGSTP
ncbi:MAG: AAA family ATPase [Caldilineaceae bacterium]